MSQDDKISLLENDKIEVESKNQEEEDGRLLETIKNALG